MLDILILEPVPFHIEGIKVTDAVELHSCIYFARALEINIHSIESKCGALQTQLCHSLFGQIYDKSFLDWGNRPS